MGDATDRGPIGPEVLGLVADDLTGAGDATVAFAEAGWHTEILLGSSPNVSRPTGSAPSDSGPNSTSRRLYAITTEARHRNDDDAAELTGRAVHTLAQAGAERLYVKVDSTVRGSIAGQVRGALDAWTRSGARASAVVCPAFPAHGRTVHEGEVLVSGTPVHRTAAGLDAVAPVTSASLISLLPGARRGGLDDVGRERVLVLDADSDPDLDDIAAAVARASAATVAIGSGGLAAALARRWGTRDGDRASVAAGGSGVLVAVSSLHPVSAAQLAHLASGLGENDIVVTPGASPHRSAQDAAAALADTVRAALERHRFAALVLVGGDGAAATLARLGTVSIVIDSQIVEGCPRGTLIGGAADGLTLVTKSGGFGDETTLTTILTRLTPKLDRADGGSATDQEERS